MNQKVGRKIIFGLENCGILRTMKTYMNILALILIVLFSLSFSPGCDDDDDDNDNTTSVPDGDDDSTDDDAVDDDDNDDSSDDDDDNDDDDNDDDDNDDDDNDDDFPPSPVYGYYQETIHEDWTWMSEMLGVMAQYDLTLFLEIPSWLIGDEDLASFLLEADTLGVDVRAWLTLPRADGYWINEQNAALFDTTAKSFVDWAQTEELGIEWIVVDMEMSCNQIYPLYDLFEQGLYLEALQFLLDQLDPVAFEASGAIYQQLVEDLHELGVYSMVVTYPQVMDDMNDGDTSIQDVLNIPVSMVEWDEISTMPYSSEWTEMSGLTFGANLVYSYAQSTVEHWGNHSSIAVGVSGKMSDVSELEADIAAAKAAGIERIQVYSYKGSSLMPNPDQWHQAFDAEAAVPPANDMTGMLRTLLKLADLII